MHIFFCRFLLLLAVFGLTLLAPGGAQTPALTVVRVAATPGDEVTPILYALSAGLFAKAGLDVQLRRMSSGSAITEAVAGGALDIGKSSLVPVIVAHSKGVPFTIIAPGLPWSSDTPLAGMVALKSAQIRSGRDLNGKVLATAAIGDLGWVGMRSWVDAHRGDSSTVHFIEVPAATVVVALETGRAQAANLPDPLLTDAVATGKVEIIGRPDDAIAKRFLTTAWFVTTDYAAKNASVIQRFDSVLATAIAYTNAHQTEMIPAIAQFSGMTLEMLAKVPHSRLLPTLDPRDIQPLINAVAKYGIIDHPFNAGDFVSAAALQLHRR